MTKNQKAVNIQMEIRKIAIQLDSVEKFSDEYWALCNKKDDLDDELMELRRMSDDDIKEEEEETNKNSDK